MSSFFLELFPIFFLYADIGKEIGLRGQLCERLALSLKVYSGVVLLIKNIRKSCEASNTEEPMKKTTFVFSSFSFFRPSVRAMAKM